MNKSSIHTTVLVLIGAAFCLGTMSSGAEQVPEPKENAQELVLTIPGPDKVQLHMKKIPAGTFDMGSKVDEERRADGEGPRHEVTGSKPFYLGVFEVTQEQWGSVMGNNPSQFKGLNKPVVNVSWEDCQAFIGKLNKMGIGTFRLPTEAEWEYACRAGTEGAYAGDVNDMAWYDVNSEMQTHPVGQKKPNAWGLYDMHGNAMEWCSDWYGPYDSNKQTDPKGAASGSYRVRRGGCWGSRAGGCRSASRGSKPPPSRGNGSGFRLARTLP